MKLPDIKSPSMTNDIFQSLFLSFSNQFTQRRRFSIGCRVSRAVCCLRTVKNARGLANRDISTTGKNSDKNPSKAWCLSNKPLTKGKISFGPYFQFSIQCLGVWKLKMLTGAWFSNFNPVKVRVTVNEDSFQVDTKNGL